MTKNDYKYSNTQVQNSFSNKTNTTTSNNNHSNIKLVVPYTKGLSKSFKKICGKISIQVHFKMGNTIRSPLMSPKDKDNITQKCGVIY